MGGLLKCLKGLLPLLVLATVSLRILTGAAEVQVNFTSLIVEEYKTLVGDADKESILRGVVVSNPSDASSIPENQKTFATYKKYLTPESAIQIPNDPPQIPLDTINIRGTHIYSFSHKVVYRPSSHSPPVIVPTYLYAHTTSAVGSVNLENYIGKIAINNSVGEFRSRQL